MGAQGFVGAYTSAARRTREIRKADVNVLTLGGYIFEKDASEF
jgi:hypothetical protein